MAKTIVLDGVEPAQVILMKDGATGKVLVQATYRVKAGNEVVKTVLDRRLTFSAGPAQTGGQTQTVPDLMTSQEQSYASAAWDAVWAALQRLEL